MWVMIQCQLHLVLQQTAKYENISISLNVDFMDRKDLSEFVKGSIRFIKVIFKNVVHPEAFKCIL